MSLTIGARLGPYEVVGMLGAGGMGEVYKARDTRLDRMVAIKVLPDTLASNPQFRDRFEREARSISALNHPNICTLYDVGQAPGADDSRPEVHFLVMEYLEGETLASRVEKGPIPVAEALTIAIEIGSALERAHRQGIVHRDLKPGNVMLTKSGAKLLDFGLARANPAGSLSGALGTAAPTATAALTAQGTILGTFQYMAPEQVEGEEADARSDLFAFGVVLYEMLTGQKAFQGKTPASLLSAILKDEVPPVSRVQPITPPALDHVVRTCLAKDPDARFQSAHDLLLQLRWIKEGGSAAGVAPPVIAQRSRRVQFTWAAGAIVALFAGFFAAWWLKPAPDVARLVTRFQYVLPQGQNVLRAPAHSLAISPDDTKIAYVANRQLYLRAMDQLEPQAVRGAAEDMIEPMFSPDGQWIAYFVAPSGSTSGAIGAGAFNLKKIPISGGAPVTLAQTTIPFGASWSHGLIMWASNSPTATGVQAVPDSGGVARMLVSVDGKQARVFQPHLLDDGKHLLFALIPLTTPNDEADIVVQSIDGGSDRKVIAHGGADPRVLPGGQLVYIHDGTLFGLRFDQKRLETAGGPIPLVEGISENNLTWAGHYAVSPKGTLIFWSGRLLSTSPRVLVWVDRQGHEQPIPARPKAYQYPRLSPDGTKIAVNSADEDNDIWVYDLKGETLTRLTFGPAFEVYSPWMPNGREVVYSSGQAGNTTARDLFRKAADGTGAATALTTNFSAGVPSSISPDGKYLVWRSGTSAEPNDLMLLPLDGSGKSRPLLADPKYNERNGEISPDGRWIAYDSSESGRYEVYVRPFPNVEGGRWQVSVEGGTFPAWSPSGRELFFVGMNPSSSFSNRMMRVELRPGPGFNYGKPEPLFDVSPYAAITGRTYDVSPDGKRFLMIKDLRSDATAPGASIVVVSNWIGEVRARVPDAR